jgi:hypothetical protein
LLEERADLLSSEPIAVVPDTHTHLIPESHSTARDRDQLADIVHASSLREVLERLHSRFPGTSFGRQRPKSAFQQTQIDPAG